MFWARWTLGPTLRAVDGPGVPVPVGSPPPRPRRHRRLALNPRRRLTHAPNRRERRVALGGLLHLPRPRASNPTPRPPTQRADTNRPRNSCPQLPVNCLAGTTTSDTCHGVPEGRPRRVLRPVVWGDGSISRQATNSRSERVGQIGRAGAVPERLRPSQGLGLSRIGVALNIRLERSPMQPDGSATPPACRSHTETSTPFLERPARASTAGETSLQTANVRYAPGRGAAGGIWRRSAKLSACEPSVALVLRRPPRRNGADQAARTQRGGC